MNILVQLVLATLACKMSASDAEFERISKLWSDPEFPGSFAGAKNFYRALQEAHIDISYPKVTQILHSIPTYVDKIRKLPLPSTRPYRVDGVDLMWECDNAIMRYKKDDLYFGFLLCIDVFSRRIFTRPFKYHDSNNLRQMFRDIIATDNFDIWPKLMQGDKEFKPMENWFNHNGARYRACTRRNKCALAEYYIFKVKRRLYNYIEHNKTRDWWNYLAQVTLNINKTPKDALGGLKPIEVLSPLDDPKVRQANPEKPTWINWREAIVNQNKYDQKKSNLNIGDLVLFDETPKTKSFQKSFDSKVSKSFLANLQFLHCKEVLCQTKHNMPFLSRNNMYSQKM